MACRSAPVASMRPARSWASAYSTAMAWKKGAMCFSRSSRRWRASAWAGPLASLASRASCAYVGSRRSIVARCRSARNLISTRPAASRTPPRALCASAVISIMPRALICVSSTTHEPPRSSPAGGMCTNTGWRYDERPSTILLPCLRISSYMSCCPPLKPRQLASMSSGSPSRSKSTIACAVLYAEFGYHTCPASRMRCSVECGFAGSAGTTRSSVRVSTAITPNGMPPRRARPTTTDVAHPASVSWNESRSKRPGTYTPSTTAPAIIARGSYGVDVGVKATSRSTGSTGGRIRGGRPRRSGTYASHRRYSRIACRSSCTTRCDTPFACMMPGPPSCRFDVYTSRPSSLFSALYPVRIIGDEATWITRVPRRARYAPIPTLRPVTIVAVKMSPHARLISPAMRPLPDRHSTPSPPRGSPTMSVMT